MELSHPVATSQPLGQVTKPGGLGQLAAGSQVTSHAHALPQLTPPEHELLPVQVIEQSVVQLVVNMHDVSPEQVT